MDEKISKILNNEEITITNDDISSILDSFTDKFSSENYLKLILLLNKSYISPNDLLNMTCIKLKSNDNAIILI